MDTEHPYTRGPRVIVEDECFKGHVDEVGESVGRLIYDVFYLPWKPWSNPFVREVVRVIQNDFHVE